MSQPKLLKVNQQMINPEAVVGLRWQEPELLVVFLQGGVEFQFNGEEAKKVWENFEPTSTLTSNSKEYTFSSIASPLVILEN